MTLARLVAAFQPLFTQRASLALRSFHSSIPANDNGEQRPGYVPGHPSPFVVSRQIDDAVVDAFDTEDTNLGDAYQDNQLVALQTEKSFSQKTIAILQTPISEYPLRFYPGARVPSTSHTAFRRLLTKAFGVGGWALIPSTKPRVRTQEDGSRYIFRDYVLYAQGKFIAHATGDCLVTKGGPENALEVAKDRALQRCCKDLGMASEIWDPTWRESWEQAPLVRKDGEGNLRRKEASGGFDSLSDEKGLF